MIEPLRVAPLAFASTLNVTVPGPDPVAPPVTTIHVTALTAVHVHPAPAVTVVMDEGVLYREVGSKEVMRKQLEHLIVHP